MWVLTEVSLTKLTWSQLIHNRRCTHRPNLGSNLYLARNEQQIAVVNYVLNKKYPSKYFKWIQKTCGSLQNSEPFINTCISPMWMHLTTHYEKMTYLWYGTYKSWFGTNGSTFSFYNTWIFTLKEIIFVPKIIIIEHWNKKSDAYLLPPIQL